MNQELEKLKPVSSPRVMDLVQEAGVDVSDWGNYKKGPAYAASNPRYCYQWSFIQPGKVAVLNLWHGNMVQNESGIHSEFNIRKHGDNCKQQSNKPMWYKRAYAMDDTIQQALKQNLPIRLIICDGMMRGLADAEQKASSVKNRLLDPEPWSITYYDMKTGDCVLSRGGAVHARYGDQFENLPIGKEHPEKVISSGSVYKRDPEVRRYILNRASGQCEYCGQPGFKMADGRLFLESHHIIPLSEDGSDEVDNAIALCPNHHREAHYGEDITDLRERFYKVVLNK